MEKFWFMQNDKRSIRFCKQRVFVVLLSLSCQTLLIENMFALFLREFVENNKNLFEIFTCTWSKVITGILILKRVAVWGILLL